MTAILGKKIGMTQVFTADEILVGVTAIQAGPCPVLAVKEKNIQLGFDAENEKKLKKPLQGYFKKLNIGACKIIREVAREPEKEYKVGEELKADLFQPGDFVDIIGTSKGKGFQGGMKRWNWSGTPQTHGSTSHRRIGSLGSSTTPGRVWKGQHLPGHMGASRVTTQNLQIVKVDVENNILLVKGAVPGHNNSYLVIRKSKKNKNKSAKPEAKKAAKK